MRKVLEPFTLTALGILIALTIHALFGDESLPARIPIRFDVMGQPTEWGSPTLLLTLPLVSVLIYLLFTAVTLAPSAFHFPVELTVENRMRLQNLACDMITWLKFEFVSLFAWIQWATIHVARHPERGLPSLMMPTALVAVFTTISSYTVRMFRVEKDPIF